MMKKIKDLWKKVVTYVKETAWIQPLLFVLAIAQRHIYPCCHDRGNIL